jgi:hypothetical protein
MDNEIISYMEMCQREGASLQRGMNYQLNPNHSVILMSVQKNAPYEDQVIDDGTTIIYEGHDVPKSVKHPNPKTVDQLERLPSGKLTENGKFYWAAIDFKSDKRVPERIRVYEKIKQGIWSYNGVFHLVDSWKEVKNSRKVFKFKLVVVEESEMPLGKELSNVVNRRIIPTKVKLEVWKRDGGKCVKCGSKENLHFDHIIPWSKGGSSTTAENIQLLCGKHNLQKHDKIE